MWGMQGAQSPSEDLSHFCCPLAMVCLWGLKDKVQSGSASSICRKTIQQWLGPRQTRSQATLPGSHLSTALPQSSLSWWRWPDLRPQGLESFMWMLDVKRDPEDHALPLHSSYCYLGLCSQVGSAPTSRGCEGEHAIRLLGYFVRPEEWRTSARDFVSLVHLGGTNSLLILFYFIFCQFADSGLLNLDKDSTKTQEDYGKVRSWMRREQRRTKKDLL